MIRKVLDWLEGYRWLRRRARMTPEEQKAAILAHVEDNMRAMSAVPSVALGPAPDCITCPRCGLTSHNPNDVAQRYCGHCQLFHADEADAHALHVEAARRLL